MTNSPIKPDEGSSNSGEKPSSDNAEEIHYKRPEFIIIDDRPKNPYGYKKQTHYRSDKERGDDPAGEQIQQGPVSLRFLCLLGLVFCLLFGACLFVAASLTSLAALLFFLQNDELNRGARGLWKLFSNIVVAVIGCTIGLLSPALGIGLLAVYFSLSGERASSDLLKKIIKSSFNFQD